jgi:hypothetical protein
MAYNRGAEPGNRRVPSSVISPSPAGALNPDRENSIATISIATTIATIRDRASLNLPLL